MRFYYPVVALILVFLVSCNPSTEKSEPSLTQSEDPITQKESERIEISQSTLQLKEGQTAVLAATVYPLSANQEVSWKSSDIGVAMVTDGTVYAMRAGKATVTVTSLAFGQSAVCSVTVIPSEEPSVTYDASSVSAIGAILAGKANLGSTMSSDLVLGMMISTSAGMLPTNSTKVVAEEIGADYTYSIYYGGLEPGATYYYRSYISQGGVDTYGEIKSFQTLYPIIETLEPEEVTSRNAVLKGKANISADDKKHLTITHGFMLNHGYVPANIDYETGIISVRKQLASNQKHECYATVTVDGVSYDGDVKEFYTPAIGVESLTLSASSLQIEFNQKTTLTATILPADASHKDITWSFNGSDAISLVKNDKATGTITILGSTPGTATISVRTLDEAFKAECECKVVGIKGPGDMKLVQGDKVQIETTVFPEFDIKYSSSDNEVAIVDDNGTLLAVDSGEASITISGNGYSYSFKVSVSKKIETSGAVDMGLSVKWAAVNLGTDTYREGGKRFHWGGTYTPGSSSWAGYIWYDTTTKTITKYNGTDKKVFLDPEDDAATVLLGDGWRTPTQKEVEDLISGCYWEMRQVKQPVNLLLFMSILQTHMGRGPKAGQDIGQLLFLQIFYFRKTRLLYNSRNFIVI